MCLLVLYYHVCGCLEHVKLCLALDAKFVALGFLKSLMLASGLYPLFMTASERNGNHVVFCVRMNTKKIVENKS